MKSRSRFWRRLALAVAVAAGLHHDVAAHSGLRFSSPLDGSTLGATPSYVQLTFLEQPEISLSTVRVVDTGGAAHHGSPEPVPGDPLSLRVPLRPLGRGVYTVHWRVVSAVDGHASSGVFVFGVLVAPSGPAASAAPVNAVAGTEVLARSVFLAGLIIVLGAAAAQIGRFGSAGALRPAVFGWLISLSGLSILIAAQSGVAGVGLGGLLATAIGRALAWRAAALAATGVALAIWTGGRRTGSRSLIGLGSIGVLVGAIAAIAVHAAAGHAAAGRWNIASAVALQVTHCAFAGIWLGGLLALIAGLKGASSDRDGAVRRFSTLAGAGFVIVTVTGLVRTVQEVSGWSDLASTAYGRIVLLKVALLAGIIGLGAVNRWRSVPMAALTLRPLRRTATIELALATLAVIAAGLLGALAPPAAGQSLAGIEASGADFATTVRARFTAASDQAGPNRFDVSLTDYDSGDPLSADRVTLRFTTLDDPSVPPTMLALSKNAGGAFSGTGANLSFDARWRVQVLIEAGRTSVEVPLEIETKGLPQFLSVLRPPGKPVDYTAEVRNIGFISVIVDPERPGPNRLHIVFMNTIYEPLAIDDVVVTTGTKAVTAVTVNRQDRNMFAGTAEFLPGRNQLSITGRASDGSRLRATFALDAPAR